MTGKQEYDYLKKLYGDLGDVLKAIKKGEELTKKQEEFLGIVEETYEADYRELD